jgi:potassium/chloride transporter 4/5/6
MWGDYLEKGQILEKAGLPSVDFHGPVESVGLYVSADIATSFTLLVGIFFPSATGKTWQPRSITGNPDHELATPDQ